MTSCFHFRLEILTSLCGFAVFLCKSAVVLAAEPAPRFSAARTDQDGCVVHDVESSYQAGKTQIRLLLPSDLKPGAQYPVVYVLPVDVGNSTRWGSGLVEIKKHDLQNQMPAIFVEPTFSHLPWYADHPTDPLIRQESYFLTVVLPFVETNYPAARERRGRLLLGFSKSGWGAWSLLLRHPDLFERAAAWDAPMMMSESGKYGSAEIFGTQENFAKYEITERLRQRSADLKNSKRLILTGYGNFREHHQQLHMLLDELQIPHEYRDAPQRKHDWHSGWVKEAIELVK